MGLVVIPNQPINLEPFAVDPCNVGDNKTYCTLYETSGMGYVQFRQTSCGGNIVSEGNFATTDDWTADAGWTYLPNSLGGSLADGQYRHVPGTSDDLEQTLTAINGKYCSVSFTISGRSAGQVSVSIGGTNMGAITSNGTFTLYEVAGVSGVLRFRASSEFDGSISYVSVFILTQEFAATLLNASDNTGAAVQPSFSYTYTMDFVTVSWAWADVPEGCYKVSVGDPCDPGTSSEILLNPSFTSLSDWTIEPIPASSDEPTQCVTISGGNVNCTLVMGTFNVELVRERVLQDIPFTNGNCYYRFSITFGHVDTLFANPLYSVVTFGLNDSVTGSIIVIDVTPSENQTFSFDWYGNISNYDNPQFIINIATNPIYSATGGEYMEIASASLKKIYDCADTSETLVSNCLALADDHDCAKRVIADCYPGSGDPVVKYGFAFDGVFKLDQQVRFLKFNPTYPVDSDDYKFSSGRRALTSAKREKFYEGLCDYADETFHDAFSTQILCDTLTIDTVEYFVNPNDYKPEWDKNGQQRLAQARIELSKKTSIIASN